MVDESVSVSTLSPPSIYILLQSTIFAEALRSFHRNAVPIVSSNFSHSYPRRVFVCVQRLKKNKFKICKWIFCTRDVGMIRVSLQKPVVLNLGIYAFSKFLNSVHWRTSQRENWNWNINVMCANKQSSRPFPNSYRRSGDIRSIQIHLRTTKCYFNFSG